VPAILMPLSLKATRGTYRTPDKNRIFVLKDVNEVKGYSEKSIEKIFWL
jgi:hypothetical protein